MLLLQFQIGAERFALDALTVVEIVPNIPLQPILRAPVGVVGLLDYHGSPTPVLDLQALAKGEAAQSRFSTRLILVQPPGLKGPDGKARLLGLVAERATETIKRTAESFVPTGIRVPDAPYLGAVTSDADGFIQTILINELLTGPVRALLDAEPMALAEATS